MSINTILVANYMESVLITPYSFKFQPSKECKFIGEGPSYGELNSFHTKTHMIHVETPLLVMQ